MSIFSQDNKKDLGPSGVSTRGCCISGDAGIVSNKNCGDGLRSNHNSDIISNEHSVIEEDFFTKAYSSLCRMQQAKDARYGNSALKPLEIFSKHHPYGSRIDEKLARIKHSDELRKNDVADIIGGLMLLCQEKGWDYFEDLID